MNEESSHSVMLWRRNTVLAVALIAFSILLSVAIGGFATLWTVAPVLCAPAGLLLIFQRSREASVLAALAVIVAGSLGTLSVYLTTPYRAPLLEVVIASTCGAIAVQGLGQYAIWGAAPKPLRPTRVALLLTLAICVQFAVAAYAAPDSEGLIGGVLFALTIGLPFLVVNIFFGSPASAWIGILYFAGTGFVCFFSFILPFALLNPPHALLSEVHLSTYQLELAFDSSRKTFIGMDWIGADFEWRDEEDVARAEGTIEPWDKQIAMQKSLRRVGLEGFSVTFSSFESGRDKNDLNVIRVRLRLFRPEIVLPTKRIGLLFYTSEFQLPLALGLTPAVLAPKPTIQIHITVPEDFGLRHNLSGDFRKTVLPDGAEGLILNSSEVQDLWGVVRLKYPIALLRNPVLATAAGINSSTLILAAQALIFGAVGFWLAVAADIIKERRIKPATEGLLARLGLIRRKEERGPTSNRRRERVAPKQ
jgi:hypothetical protein